MTDPGPHTSSAPPPVFRREDLDALAALIREHPIAASPCEQLQALGVAMLQRMIDDMAHSLAAQEDGQSPAAQGGVDFRRAAGAARNRASAARERRELAQDLVLGAIVNIDNPDWNPLDPATSRKAEDSALLCFLGLAGGSP